MIHPPLPAPTAALLAQAKRALGAGRLESAVALARAAVWAAPSTRATIMLADVLADAGYPAEARVALAPLAAHDRDLPTTALATIAGRNGQLEEAISLLKIHLAAYPRRRLVHYQLASVLPHVGKFDEANHFAARGTLIVCGDLQLTSSRVIRFPESTGIISRTVPFERRVSYDKCTPAMSAEAIYVVGCDSRYFTLFGEALATSLARRARAQFTLHFHLVNPDSSVEALLRRLRVQALVPIVCSRENVDLSMLGARQRRVYMACARYLVLPELLQRYGKPMLIADADQLVLGDLRGLLHDLRKHDVGILRDDRHTLNILSLISASVLGINDSVGGRRFANTLCATITERMCDPAGMSWHLDQAALAVASLWHRELRLLKFPLSTMDSVTDPMASPDMLDSRALFWSITLTYEHTVRKLQTSLFRQFVDFEPV